MSAMPHRVYHKPRRKKYAYGSVASAIARAKRTHHDAIDLDMTVDHQGNRWCNHWQQLMLRDAWYFLRGRTRRKTRQRISEMPTAEVRKLRSPWGPIISAHWAMVLCKRVGITPCFESKHDPGGHTYSVAWWKAFRQHCNKYGFDPVIMSLPDGGLGIKRLAAAHEAGFRTMWLWRGPYPAAYNAHLTYVKSRPGRGIYRV